MQNELCPDGQHLLIVVDSVGYALGTDGGGDPAGPFLRLAQAMRTLQHVTWELIDHDSKGAIRGKETPYGSRYKQAAARNAWLIRKSHEPGAAIHIGLWHDPTSNVAPRAPLGYRIEFDGQDDDLRRVTFHREDLRDVEGFGDLLTDWQKMERALRGGAPQHVKDLSEETGLPENRLRARLSERRRRHQDVDRLPDGRWTLVDRTRASP
jgi:hypothetical protein